MFLPFRRHASGRKGGSVGLGLYIVDRLVRAHGGRVEVRSTEAEGTTFKVLLPLGASMLDRPDELASTMARSGPDARSNGAKAP